jgi:hypothetical protein
MQDRAALLCCSRLLLLLLLLRLLLLGLYIIPSMRLGILGQQVLPCSSGRVCCGPFLADTAGQALHSGVEVWLEEKCTRVALLACSVDHAMEGGLEQTICPAAATAAAAAKQDSAASQHTAQQWQAAAVSAISTARLTAPDLRLQGKGTADICRHWVLSMGVHWAG